MQSGHLIIGYHGCDVTTRDGLVSGRKAPLLSSNSYDWLGPGFYVFENDRERAEAFAEHAAAAPEKRLTANPIAHPSVVGCIFSVQRCLDMTTKNGLMEFEAAANALQDGFQRTAEKPLPTNRAACELDTEGLLHCLDNAVFGFIHQHRDDQFQGIHYQAVRGAFRQGAEISPGSGFHRDSHIQIALRDPECIIGWFLPGASELLGEAGYQNARQALERLQETHPKPHKRLALAE